MNEQRISIADFTRNDDFYEPIDLVLTIKSFDLQAIRRRYLESRKRNVSGRVGSVKRRDVTVGGIARVTLTNGSLTDAHVIARMPEPRGVCAGGDRLIVSAEDTVLVIDAETIRTIEHPWFSYIHTVDLSDDGNALLVSSSGLDCVFEYDTCDLRQTFEWFAWENGFDTATDPADGDPVYLTRDPDRARDLAERGARVKLIRDPKTQFLPTAMRAAFINSVTYDRAHPGGVLATMFHRGGVFRVDRDSGVATKVLDGLTTPHGGRNYGSAYFAASTGSGEIVAGDLEQQVRYSVADVPGKPDALAEMEWVQNAAPSGGRIIAIDSNRSAFVVFDPTERLYSVVPYDPEWAIQDLVPTRLGARCEATLASATTTPSAVEACLRIDDTVACHRSP